MEITPCILVPLLYVCLLKFYTPLVGRGDYKKVEQKTEYGNCTGGKHIRIHHPLETYSSGQYGNDLRVGSKFGCKENNRNEYEHRAEHIHVIWDKVCVVIEDYLI